MGAKDRAVSEAEAVAGPGAIEPVPWHRRWAVGGNVYDLTELAGAFGDLGTLIPFVVGYIAVLKVDPLDRPVTDRMMAVSQGIMNLVSAPLGGIPLCHGAGGMAGHVRFGARTGGSLVLLGLVMMALALFFGDSVGLLFQIFPKAVLGVILFFAGAELAITTRDIGGKKEDVYVMLVVAGFTMWNMGAAFLVGVALHQALRRGWVTV